MTTYAACSGSRNASASRVFTQAHLLALPPSYSPHSFTHPALLCSPWLRPLPWLLPLPAGTTCTLWRDPRSTPSGPMPPPAPSASAPPSGRPWRRTAAPGSLCRPSGACCSTLRCAEGSLQAAGSVGSSKSGRQASGSCWQLLLALHCVDGCMAPPACCACCADCAGASTAWTTS